MISLRHAWECIDEACVGAQGWPIEPCQPSAAANRILAADVLSPLSLPPFDKAAVDGYALSAGPEEGWYAVRETVAAGHIPAGPLGAGEAARVMTGAPVPPGTARVVKREHAELQGGRVRVLQAEKKANICMEGEDIRRGETLLVAGTRLGPLEIANLIACGVVEVPVARSPRVSLLITGDEIVHNPAAMAPGKIIDTNGPLLSQLLRRDGFELVSRRIVSDGLETTVSALQNALDAADLTLVCGGVSVGDFDFVPAAMQRAGLSMAFAGVSIKPGKPTVFASRKTAARTALVFGLPGNPVAVYLAYHLLVRRALARLCNAPAPCREFALPLASPYSRRAADRLELVPGRLGPDGRVTPIRTNGPAHLRALLAADVFFLVPEGQTALEPPQTVSCLCFEPQSLR